MHSQQTPKQQIQGKGLFVKALSVGPVVRDIPHPLPTQPAWWGPVLTAHCRAGRGSPSVPCLLRPAGLQDAGGTRSGVG